MSTKGISNDDRILILKPDYFNFGTTPSMKKSFNPHTMTHQRAQALAGNGFSQAFRWGTREESTNPGERIPELGGYTVGQTLFRKKPKKGNFDPAPFTLIQFETVDEEGKEMKDPIVVVRPSWAVGSHVERTALSKMLTVYQIEDPSVEPEKKAAPAKKEPTKDEPNSKSEG